MGPPVQRTILNHLSVSSLLPVIRFGYGFTLAALLSKQLSVEAYGHWSLFISMLGLVLTFSSLNLMYATNVLLPGQDITQQKRDIFSVAVTRMVVTIIVFAGFVVYLHYNQVFTGDILALLLLALVFRTVNDLCFGLCRSLLMITRQVLFLFAESALILFAIVVVCYYYDGGLYGALYGFIMAEAAAAVFGFVLLREYLSLSQYQFSVVKKYLAIGLPLIPFAFSDLIINSLVPLLMKLYDSFESVALYSIAQKVALAATIPTAIVNNVYAQYLKKSRLSDRTGEVRKTFLTFLGIYLAMVAPVALIMFFFGRDIIILISTAEYTSSYQLMLLLVLTNIMVSIGALVTTLFAVYERTKVVGMIWLAVLVLFVSISGYCFERWQIEGVAYALIISFGAGLTGVSVSIFALKRWVRQGRADKHSA